MRNATNSQSFETATVMVCHVPQDRLAALNNDLRNSPIEISQSQFFPRVFRFVYESD